MVFEDWKDYICGVATGTIIGMVVGGALWSEIFTKPIITPNEVYVIDLNGDGLKDVVAFTKSKDPHDVYQFMQHKDGTFKMLEDMEKYDIETVGEKIRDYKLEK